MANVLDASALLCFLHGEVGHEIVASALTGGVMSSVNWSEVLQKAIANGVNTSGLQEDLQALGLKILPFTAEEAAIAAGLWEKTQHLGLSLADRACLSLGTRLNTDVVTADRVWGQIKLPINVRLIR